MSAVPLSVDHAEDRQRPARALLRSPVLVWAALFINVQAFLGLPTAIPIPVTVGQLITQGALVVALLLVIIANPGGVIRPSLFLALLTMLAVVALMVSIHNEFPLGSTYRACRFIAFVLVLWLLSPWWGRADLMLLRAHLTCLRVMLLSVLVGALLAPGVAFSYGGRLSGALWPTPPTQVAHYAAVLFGCTVVLWFGQAIRGPVALLTLLGAGAALIGTHTRTALLSLTIGLAVAGASMFLGHARVRRTSALVSIFAVIPAALFAPLIFDWLLRGQTIEEARQLTGRTLVWSAILQHERPWLQEAFGSGLSNKSFNGLSIDNNWLAVFLDQGWFGVFVEAALILTLVLLAVTHPRGIKRGVALFLVSYCLIDSITETGLADASPYLLDLVVAASLLAVPIRKGGT